MARVGCRREALPRRGPRQHQDWRADRRSVGVFQAWTPCRCPRRNQPSNRLVREVVAEAWTRPSGAARGDRFPAALAGDRTLLRHVCGNLKSRMRSVAAARRRSPDRVSGRQAADENVYSVRDNGVGSICNTRQAVQAFVRQRSASRGRVQRDRCGPRHLHACGAHGGRVWADGKVDGVRCFLLASGTVELLIPRGSEDGDKLLATNPDWLSSRSEA